MYKQFYNTDYIFVPKNPNPYSSKECRDAWALLVAFGKDANEVRKYIVWLFRKGINKNTAITHFGYINTPGIIRKYKLYAMKKNILTRSTILSQEFIDWCNIHTSEIFVNYTLGTMNDLGALLSYVKCYDADIKEDGIERKVLLKAEQCGFIKDGKLNIGENNEKNSGE
jgi:dimeric dUTPase (all-alpha-NTP-PPase superfamily)